MSGRVGRRTGDDVRSPVPLDDTNNATRGLLLGYWSRGDFGP